MRSSGFLSPVTLSPGLAASPRLPLEKSQKAAQEFEAQLLTSLLGSLEKTFVQLPGGEGETVTGQDDYAYIGTEALASTLAAQGGFGIARMIARQLDSTKVSVAAGESASTDGG